MSKTSDVPSAAVAGATLLHRGPIYAGEAISAGGALADIARSCPCAPHLPAARLVAAVCVAASLAGAQTPRQQPAQLSERLGCLSQRIDPHSMHRDARESHTREARRNPFASIVSHLLVRYLPDAASYLLFQTGTFVQRQLRRPIEGDLRLSNPSLKVTFRDGKVADAR
jgi:hypothetical protein